MTYLPKAQLLEPASGVCIIILHAPNIVPAGADFGFRIIDVSRAQIDYSSPLYPRYCSGQPLNTQQGPRRAFVRI